MNHIAAAITNVNGMAMAAPYITTMCSFVISKLFVSIQPIYPVAIALTQTVHDYSDVNYATEGEGSEYGGLSKRNQYSGSDR